MDDFTVAGAFRGQVESSKKSAETAKSGPLPDGEPIKPAELAANAGKVVGVLLPDIEAGGKPLQCVLTDGGPFGKRRGVESLPSTGESCGASWVVKRSIVRMAIGRGESTGMAFDMETVRLEWSARIESSRRGFDRTRPSMTPPA